MEDLENLNYRDLQKLAKSLGLKGRKKTQLVEEIRALQGKAGNLVGSDFSLDSSEYKSDSAKKPRGRRKKESAEEVSEKKVSSASKRSPSNKSSGKKSNDKTLTRKIVSDNSSNDTSDLTSLMSSPAEKFHKKLTIAKKTPDNKKLPSLSVKKLIIKKSSAKKTPKKTEKSPKAKKSSTKKSPKSLKLMRTPTSVKSSGRRGRSKSSVTNDESSSLLKDATVDITFNNNATFVRKTDSKKKSSERKKNTVVVKVEKQPKNTKPSKRKRLSIGGNAAKKQKLEKTSETEMVNLDVIQLTANQKSESSKGRKSKSPKLKTQKVAETKSPNIKTTKSPKVPKTTTSKSPKLIAKLEKIKSKSPTSLKSLKTDALLEDQVPIGGTTQSPQKKLKSQKKTQSTPKKVASPKKLKFPSKKVISPKKIQLSAKKVKSPKKQQSLPKKIQSPSNNLQDPLSPKIIKESSPKKGLKVSKASPKNRDRKLKQLEETKDENRLTPMTKGAQVKDFEYWQKMHARKQEKMHTLEEHQRLKQQRALFLLSSPPLKKNSPNKQSKITAAKTAKVKPENKSSLAALGANFYKDVSSSRIALVKTKITGQGSVKNIKSSPKAKKSVGRPSKSPEKAVKSFSGSKSQARPLQESARKIIKVRREANAKEGKQTPKILATKSSHKTVKRKSSPTKSPHQATKTKLSQSSCQSPKHNTSTRSPETSLSKVGESIKRSLGEAIATQWVVEIDKIDTNFTMHNHQAKPSKIPRIFASNQLDVKPQSTIKKKPKKMDAKYWQKVHARTQQKLKALRESYKRPSHKVSRKIL